MYDSWKTDHPYNDNIQGTSSGTIFSEVLNREVDYWLEWSQSQTNIEPDLSWHEKKYENNSKYM